MLKIIVILISIGIIFILVFFLIPLHKWTAHTGPSNCIRVESDARNIATAIADYFSDPEHTDIKPSNLELDFIENPWTFTKCGDEIIIVVFDREMKCQMEGQNDRFEWFSHFCIFRPF